MIITEIREWDFLANQTLNEVFTIEALEKLYEYYEEYSECCENQVWNFDPVAIRCEWREETPEEIRNCYSNLEDIAETEGTRDLLFEMESYTTAILLNNGNILYVEF